MLDLPLEVGQTGRVTEPLGERVAVDLELRDLKRQKSQIVGRRANRDDRPSAG